MTNSSAAKPPVTITRREDRVAIVTIDRPERRNALNLEVKGLIAGAIETLAADDSVQVIVLTGAGGCFVAGTDIAEMVAMTPQTHVAQRTGHVFDVLRHCPKILIAAVEGYALGGGCELALCCDMIVAGEDAAFGQPEIRVGIMPGAGGSQRLIRAIGKYRAMKLMLTGEAVKAPEALAMGMITEVVAKGGALDRALALARTVTTMPPLAVRAVKEVVGLGQDVPLETALALERKAFVMLFDSADQTEGMTAFLEKRKPVYQGR
ncbi:enoyl-CoA hydratase-related protein [Rhodoplanes sp. TEM]|uniref:Enoyl-CoA hydratase-related protein n=1 Tax=Rhodoplanes tepidamans TaxID=200616 RepID=A0ABT5J7F5_RHOTP|nr:MULTISPECIES: enoyl-CoA hydratase-related protein [Rhodoplanes]MDC7785316.1 enoyl-CoA hydratase-related protein [Rhodoplanes tepidamans]MDC7987281.1 enoyl-CoA hydratase-related protein [Rhodoplanes sp. TEM]MDQ0353575.1 enoyl-CoA hydratase/carnithine racemase [Rhodoplanes tepidamans]